MTNETSEWNGPTYQFTLLAMPEDAVYGDFRKRMDGLGSRGFRFAGNLCEDRKNGSIIVMEREIQNAE